MAGSDLLPRIRPSTRSAWRSCPRKVFFGEIAGVHPRSGRKALVVGKAYHAGLEWWRRQPKDAKNPEEAAFFAASRFRAFAAEDSVPIDEYTHLQVYAYVMGYTQRFASAEVELVEQAVFDDGDGEGGTADCVSKFADGSVWVIEDKTTAKFDDEEAMKMALLFNDQISTYVQALRSRGVGAEGARYRQVKKTMTYPRKGESIEAYGERVLGLYTDEGAEDGIDLYREFVVTWSEAEMARCMRQRERENLEIVSHLDVFDVEKWPYNPLSCIGPYGPCDYVRLCARRKDASERLYKPSPREALDGGSFQREIWQCGSGSEAGRVGGEEGRDSSIFKQPPR